MINEIDIDRARHEILPQNYKKLVEKKWYGALRYATYIENYCSYDTYSQFVEQATIEELDDMERDYLNDWESRKYSKVFKMFIPQNIIDNISEIKWKKILKSDITQFYETIMKDNEKVWS